MAVPQTDIFSFNVVLTLVALTFVFILTRAPPYLWPAWPSALSDMAPINYVTTTALNSSFRSLLLLLLFTFWIIDAVIMGRALDDIEGTKYGIQDNDTYPNQYKIDNITANDHKSNMSLMFTDLTVFTLMCVALHISATISDTLLSEKADSTSATETPEERAKHRDTFTRLKNGLRKAGLMPYSEGTMKFVNTFVKGTHSFLHTNGLRQVLELLLVTRLLIQTCYESNIFRIDRGLPEAEARGGVFYVSIIANSLIMLMLFGGTLLKLSELSIFACVNKNDKVSPERGWNVVKSDLSAMLIGTGVDDDKDGFHKHDDVWKTGNGSLWHSSFGPLLSMSLIFNDIYYTCLMYLAFPQEASWGLVCLCIPAFLAATMNDGTAFFHPYVICQMIWHHTTWFFYIIRISEIQSYTRAYMLGTPETGNEHLYFQSTFYKPAVGFRYNAPTTRGVSYEELLRSESSLLSLAVLKLVFVCASYLFVTYRVFFERMKKKAGTTGQ